MFRLREEGGRWVSRELFTCGSEFCRARGLDGIDHGPNDDYKQILSFGEDQKGRYNMFNKYGHWYGSVRSGARSMFKNLSVTLTVTLTVCLAGYNQILSHTYKLNIVTIDDHFWQDLVISVQCTVMNLTSELKGSDRIVFPWFSLLQQFGRYADLGAFARGSGSLRVKVIVFPMDDFVGVDVSTKGLSSSKGEI